MPSALLLMLAVMAGVTVSNLYYCQPLLNLIRNDIGLSEFQVNLVPVATQVGKYIPRYGTERINALGVALQTLAWIIMALFQNYYIGIILGIVIIDVGMQCVQLSNQSATMGLCPEAASRMNAIYMVCYFIGGSLGTFLAGTMWSVCGWYGTVATGLFMILGAVLVGADPAHFFPSQKQS